MRTLTHITDLHFGKLTPGTVECLEEQIGRTRPDMCIISGDLTIRSRPHEWKAAREFLDRLPVPYMVVPGNHDLPYFNLYERFRYPYRRFRHYVSNDLNPLFADEEIAIMGINTARPIVPHYTWKEGGISDQQIKMTQIFFENVQKSAFKIVFTHHPFLPPPGKPRTYLVRNARAALEAFEELNIDMVLGGHLHLGYAGIIPFFYRNITRNILCIQQPTATSSRLRDGAPNGYCDIRIHNNSAEVTFKQWNGTDFEEKKKVPVFLQSFS